MGNYAAVVEAQCCDCGNWTDCVVRSDGAYPICPICLANTREDNMKPKLDNDYLTPQEEEALGLVAKPRKISSEVGTPIGKNQSPELLEESRKIYSFEVLNVASSMQHAIARTVQKIGRALLDKNRKYGNSALNPIRVHSTSDSVEQIKVRADDKLSRLRAAQEDDAEDALFDYIGYLILLHIAEHQATKNIKS